MLNAGLFNRPRISKGFQVHFRRRSVYQRLFIPRIQCKRFVKAFFMSAQKAFPVLHRSKFIAPTFFIRLRTTVAGGQRAVINAHTIHTFTAESH